MMKMLSLVSCSVLAATVLSLSAYGDDAPAPQAPTAPQDIKLTPEMQATLGQLLKMLTPDQTGAPQAGAPQNGAPQAGTTDVNKMAPLIAQLMKSLNADQGGAADPAKAADPNKAVDVNKLAPMVAQLLKMLDVDSTDDSKPATAPTSANTSTTPANDQKPQQTNPLQVHSLRSSGGLVTHSLDGTPRMTNDQWRDLFPTKH